MSDIVERLRDQHLHHCFQVDREAADEIASLRARLAEVEGERDEALSKLEKAREACNKFDIAVLSSEWVNVQFATQQIRAALEDQS